MHSRYEVSDSIKSGLNNGLCNIDIELLNCSFSNWRFNQGLVKFGVESLLSSSIIVVLPPHLPPFGVGVFLSLLPVLLMWCSPFCYLIIIECHYGCRGCVKLCGGGCRMGLAVVAMTSQCSRCETLMSMLASASTAFALHWRPLAERCCCVHSNVAHNAHCRHWHHCLRRCHLCVLVVIALTPSIAVPTSSGEPLHRHLPLRRRAPLRPISFLLIVA